MNGTGVNGVEELFADEEDSNPDNNPEIELDRALEQRALDELPFDPEFDEDDDEDDEYDLGELMQHVQAKGRGKEGFLKFMEYQRELKEQGLFMKGGFDAAMRGEGEFVKGGSVVPRVDSSSQRGEAFYAAKGAAKGAGKS